MPNHELPLDKEGWVTYINKHKGKIGYLLRMKESYDDLQFCLNPDMNEKAFMAAYRETILNNEN